MTYDSNSRDFKGIWIPNDIWLDKELTALDKVLLAEIDSFCINGKGCSAGNQYFADFCQCSEKKVSTSISKLTKLGYVERVGFDGRVRILQSRIAKKSKQTSKKVKTESQKSKGSLSNINTYINTSIKDNVELGTREVEIEQIITYLNDKLGTNYRCSTKAYRSHINARLDDKFTVDDFITVIDKKYDEWYGTKMEKYLTPDTLFGTKFEKYLNQNIVSNSKNTLVDMW